LRDSLSTDRTAVKAQLQRSTTTKGDAEMKRRHALAGGMSSALAGWIGRSGAQDHGLIRIVVPYAAGGQTDSLARVMANSLQKNLGRTVIVDNRPGAAGLIATRYAQAAAPDGDTLLFQNAGFVALPMLMKAATYDPVRDFDAVAMTGSGPNFLMVTDSVPARTMPEFLAYARSQPQGIECANSGINSTGHIAAMMLERLAGIKLVHVPYKGSAEVTRALLSGDVKMQLSVTTDSLNPFIKSGRIRLIAVTPRERTSLSPDIPTIGEFLPGYAIEGWFGMLTSAGTPLALRDAVSAAIKLALEEPTTRERFAALYMEVIHRGPEKFAATIRESVRYFAKIVEELQLVAQ
jgi:tripartite-type tricarboxylate transporter receptor subunit TctC